MNEPTDHQLYEWVRGALLRINDLGALKEHPITALIAQTQPPGDESPGLRTRLFLLALIEQMRPSEDMAAMASEWRQYHILKDRYEHHRPLWEIEKRLSLSERQLRREHQRALHAYAALAHTRLRSVLSSEASSETTPDLLREAVHRLLPSPGLFDLAPLFNDVIGIVKQSLCGPNQQGQGMSFCAQVEPASLSVYTDRGILHQLLFKLCQLFLRQCHNGVRLSLTAQLKDQQVEVRLHVEHASLNGQDQGELQLCEWLAESLPARLILAPEGASFVLPLREQARKILIIDDEPLALNLYRSYLADLNYDISTETKPEHALQRALEIGPDVIVLDVMMPAMDGWELLQRLRHTSALRDVPIIACSVLDDAVLARTLGATQFMKKPILRRQFIRVLSELLGQAEA